MAYHAAAGPIAAVGLAALAIATAICVSLGARSAVRRRFADHRRWMWRCYLLLCSAVVLRLIGGLATVTGVAAPWVDPLATWMSWLVPLAAFEIREWTRRESLALCASTGRESRRQQSRGISRLIEFKAATALAVTIAADRPKGRAHYHSVGRFRCRCPEIDINARRTVAGVLAFRNLTRPSTKHAFMPPA